jgi:hypothetical protein
MDEELSIIAREAVEACARQRRDQTNNARIARIRKRAADHEAASLPLLSAVEIAALALPGAAEVLGVRAKTLKYASPQALLSLALSPKVRGSGPAVDRARSAQQAGLALVATTVLGAQDKGLWRWIGDGDENGAADSDVRGYSAMWDEASQRARALLQGPHVARAQSTVEVFVMLSALHAVTVSDGIEHWAWQPWLAPPMLLQSTQHRALLDALDSCMPFAFSDKETFVRFGQGVKASILSFNFDYASSNVSAYRHMVFVIGKLPLAASHVMLHGERCLTHGLHIVKCDGLVSEGISGVLYSLSKIIAHGRSMNGVIAAMRAHVRSRLVVRNSPRRFDDNLFKVLKGVLALDGRWDDGAQLPWDALHSGENSEKSRRPRAMSWLADLKKICAVCHFEGGKWIYHCPSTAAGPGAKTEDDVVEEILDPLVKVLVTRRWGVAALNRWTGTIAALKRVVLGAVLNNVLPESLSGLGAEMALTEAKAEVALRKAHVAQLAGEEGGQGEVYWATHCKRVLRLSTFFACPTVRGNAASC